MPLQYSQDTPEEVTQRPYYQFTVTESEQETFALLLQAFAAGTMSLREVPPPPGTEPGAHVYKLEGLVVPTP